MMVAAVTSGKTLALAKEYLNAQAERAMEKARLRSREMQTWGALRGERTATHQPQIVQEIKHWLRSSHGSLDALI